MHLLSSITVVGLATLIAAAPQPGFVDKEWDVIVVGAGPAGIIMADRMSEAGKKTLLLEDGGPSYYITGGRERPSWLDGTKLSRVDVPGLYKSIFSDPSPMLCNTQQVAHPAIGACTVGGNSAINAGLFFQPPSSDFDKYFPDNWHSQDMESAISKLNNRQPSSGITSENGHRYLMRGYTAAKEWLVNHAGFREVQFKGSPNDKSKVFGHPVFDYHDGQRGGPVVSYLQRAKERSNFRFEHGVRVHRVTRHGKHATGVDASVQGQDARIKLAKNGRVILSGGAIQSPALLMKSAIGDPDVLRSMDQAGVLQGHTPDTWINNTAVGKGLFDNPNTFIELQSNYVNSYVYSYSDPKPSDASLYLKHRSGPYAFASETAAFWDTVKRSDGTIATMQGTIDSAGYDGYSDPHTITLNVYGTSGMGSRGKVVFDSSWTPGPSSDVYYSDPQDAQAIATFIRRIFDALPASKLTSLNIDQGASVDEIVQYITTPSAYAANPTNHWSSSCRLGHCVDQDALVKGMGNLHVVDGSIVPPLSVNPQMGIMIAAERAAERILKL